PSFPAAPHLSARHVSNVPIPPAGCIHPHQSDVLHTRLGGYPALPAGNIRAMATDRFTASGFPAVDRAGDAERYVQYLDAQAATPFWKEAKRATIDALALPRGATALDVGCGTGEEVRAMAAIAGAAMGVDASRTLVEEARRR